MSLYDFSCDFVSVPAQCYNEFDDYDEITSTGGDPVLVVPDLDACLDACRADSDCQAVDYHSNTKICSIHEGTIYLDNLRGDEEGITQYRKVPCEGITSPSPSQ